MGSEMCIRDSFVIAVAAAEVGVGLAMVLLLYRNRRNIDLAGIDSMKG